MVTESNKGNSPPYIVNLFERDRLDEYTVDITKFLSTEGLVFYLNEISHRFNNMELKDNYEKNQLYFIAQLDFSAIKVGLSRSPKDRLITLQTGNPMRLILLFFYEPTERNKGLFGMEDVCMDCFEHEARTLDWFGGDKRLHGEWFKPDDRSLRILIKEGLSVLGVI